MRVELTDRFVKSAATIIDDEVIRFGIRVRETGRKSFTLDYMFEGRRRRLYIGDFPDWSTIAAREHAKLPQAQNRSCDRFRKPRHLGVRLLLRCRSPLLAPIRSVVTSTARSVRRSLPWRVCRDAAGS